MERINSIQQLRLQKELLQTQQLIAELRMKKDFHLIKNRMTVTGLVLPSIKHFVKAGLKSKVGKQLLFSTVTVLGKRLLRRKSRKAV